MNDRFLNKVINKETVNRIIVYRTGSLGDTVVALPVLHLIRSVFPAARLWLLTNQSENEGMVSPCDLLEGSGLIDHYLFYTSGTAGLTSIGSTLQHIRRINADLLFYLPEARNRMQLLRDRLFFLYSGFWRPLGWYSDPGKYLSPLLPSGRFMHEAERLLRSVPIPGTIDLAEKCWWDLDIKDADALVGKEYLLECSAQKIVFSYGAKTDVQKWDKEKWQYVFDVVSRADPDTVLFALGGKCDREDTQEILHYWQGEKYNLCGETRVRQTAWLMKNADLFIGHDSGPAHLAAAMQLPCICVYSGRNVFGKWFPYGKHKIFYSNVSCVGCGKSICREMDKQCIRAIDEKRVAKALLAKLSAFR